jgi:hypothetical protein
VRIKVKKIPYIAGKYHILVEDEKRRARILSHRDKELLDAENYAEKAVRRFNRQHDCKEEA